MVKLVPTGCHVCFTGGPFVLFGRWMSAAESGKQVRCTVALASVHSDPQRDESLSLHWQKCWDSFYPGLKPDRTEERSPQTSGRSVKVSQLGRTASALWLQDTPSRTNDRTVAVSDESWVTRLLTKHCGGVGGDISVGWAVSVQSNCGKFTFNSEVK